MADLGGRVFGIEAVQAESRAEDSAPAVSPARVELSLAHIIHDGWSRNRWPVPPISLGYPPESCPHGHATRSVESYGEVLFAAFPSAWRAWRRFSTAFS